MQVASANELRVHAVAANGIDSFSFFARDPIKESSEVFQRLHASLPLARTTRPTKLADLIF